MIGTVELVQAAPGPAGTDGNPLGLVEQRVR
jgi:hypothetical protein